MHVDLAQILEESHFVCETLAMQPAHLGGLDLRSGGSPEATQSRSQFTGAVDSMLRWQGIPRFWVTDARLAI